MDRQARVSTITMQIIFSLTYLAVTAQMTLLMFQ